MKFSFFSFKYLLEKCPFFVGPRIPPFRNSGTVSSGFQPEWVALFALWGRRTSYSPFCREFIVSYYRLLTKLYEGNVFTHVILSVLFTERDPHVTTTHDAISPNPIPIPTSLGSGTPAP